MPARVMLVVTALMTINSFNTSTENHLPKTGSITVKINVIVEQKVNRHFRQLAFTCGHVSSLPLLPFYKQLWLFTLTN